MYRLGLLIFLISTLLSSCYNQHDPWQEQMQYQNQSDEAFNNYWYQGKAELNNYDLSQSRYGENREGKAVLVFVTEDFLTQAQVKKERESSRPSTTVLKLNSLKKFTTGIYDYAIMTSSFNPVNQNKLSMPLKVTASMQEWCGHSWMQLNKRSSAYEIANYSYFEEPGDLKMVIQEPLLEDGLWNQLRLNPEAIPLGEQKIVPSSEFFKLHRKAIKAYKAKLTIKSDSLSQTSILRVEYPNLKRSLKIVYQTDFPHNIEQWEEIFVKNGQEERTTARLKQQILTDYWNKNKLADSSYRELLFPTD
jgi:hypothetical protein